MRPNVYWVIPVFMKNTGMPSEDIFKRIVKSLGKSGFTFKLPDASDAFGRNKRLVNVAKQPGDFLVVENGEMYLADVKSTTHATAFPFSMIKDTQMAAARMIEAAGGRYYFIVHRIETNDWFKVTASTIRSHPKKSLKWSELEPYRWKLADAFRKIS